MKNNTLPLVLTRISLGITLLYIGALFILFTPSSSDPSEGDGIGMMIAFLFPAFSYISNCYYIKYYYFNWTRHKPTTNNYNTYYIYCIWSTGHYFYSYFWWADYPSNYDSSYLIINCLHNL